MLRAVCASSIGMRPTHEDNFLLNGRILDNDTQLKMSELKMVQLQSVCYKKVNFIAVSDGMGGHNAGEVASRFCVEKLASVEETVQNCVSLEEVISVIQQEIAHINVLLCEKGIRYSDLHGMGATMVMLVSFENEYAILNIGDSRAYSVSDHSLRQITKDHTEGQRMIDLGILTRKEVESFPAKKHLNRYFGYSANGYQLRADVFRLPETSEMVLLCSDGVSDMFDEQKVADYLTSNEESWDMTRRIVEDAACTPNSDNTTAIVIEINRR